MTALLAVLATLAGALSEVSARLTLGVVAASVVFAVAQVRGGEPAADAINGAGWAALAAVGACAAFRIAALLLTADDGGRSGAVTA